MCFHYNEEVVRKQEAKTGFKIGDKVRVKESRGGSYKLLPATIESDARIVSGEYGHDIKLLDGGVIYFFARNLEFFPVPAAPKAQIKVGDRVKVTYGYGWNGDGVVTKISGGVTYHVKYDSGRPGGFYLKNLTLLPAAPKQTIGAAYVAGRNAAVRLAKQNGKVTADEVQSELSKLGYTSTDLGNAAGAIFRSSGFRKVGEVRSTRQGNRGRKIAQWELTSERK